MTALKSGVGKLLDDVAAYFVKNKISADVAYGWRERQKQPAQGKQGRVVFTPSDDDGAAGELARTSRPGAYRTSLDGSGNVIGKVRALTDWDRILVVSVWAHDPGDSNNERRQSEAVEALVEWVLRAVNASTAGAANALWGKAKWTTSTTELRNGAELRLWLTLKTPLFDLPNDVTYPAPAVNPSPAKS